MNLGEEQHLEASISWRFVFNNIENKRLTISTSFMHNFGDIAKTKD